MGWKGECVQSLEGPSAVDNCCGQDQCEKEHEEIIFSDKIVCLFVCLFFYCHQQHIDVCDKFSY